MDIKATLRGYVDMIHRKASLQDEAARYLSGPWLEELTVAMEHEAKRWFWWGVGGGLLVGLAVGSVAWWLA